MAVGLLLVWSGLGVAFLNQSNVSKLAWSFRWKEEKEGIECHSSLSVLDYLKREK